MNPMKATQQHPKPVSPVVQVDRLCVRRAGQLIIQDVSLSLMPGSIMSVIGPNGGGKSTLLKVIAGLETPSSGSVVRSSKLKIGYVPQSLHIPEALPLSARSFLSQVQLKLPLGEWQALLQTLEITTWLDLPVHSLSGGQRQRLLLARALKQQPELLLLDEPMQGVDVESQHLLYELIRNWPARYNAAVLLVSHDVEWVMAGTDQVLCMNKHLCCSGRPDQIQDSAEFLGLFAAPRQHYSHHHHCSHEHLESNEVNS